MVLSENDPPIALAKIDCNENVNKEIASKYEVRGFPTLKIFRNGGEDIQEYKGPREADGIVEYLSKQVGPASTEIKSTEDVDKVIVDKKISIVRHILNFFLPSLSAITTMPQTCFTSHRWGYSLNSLGRNLKLLLKLLKSYDRTMILVTPQMQSSFHMGMKL